ncbi:MAG: hypothetical protein AAF441_16635, partial [Pseudomonadota bacterium]
MATNRTTFAAGALALAMICAPSGSAVADENGYGEDIRSGVFGSGGHHGHGGNGRSWIPRATGTSIGILRVYRTQAVINIDGTVYWTHDVKWDPAYERVCVGWPAGVPASGGCWMALVNKGVRLGQLGRSEDEIVVYDEVADTYRNDPDPELRVQVAQALYNKGVRLGQLGRSEDEIVVYDEVA